MKDAIKELDKFGPKRQVSLSQITTFGVGGKATYMIEVKSSDDLLLVWKILADSKIKRYLVAGGSNVLFSDKGFDGVVVNYKQDGNKDKDIVFNKGGRSIFVEANASLLRLVKFSIEKGFVGFESFYGIPGTVGGAVVGSAGAYGNSVSNFVSRVLIFDGKNIRWLKRKDCKFSYRESIFKTKKAKDWVILGVEFIFSKKGSSVKMAKRAKDISKLRTRKYGKKIRCPGSYFKNILVEETPKKILFLVEKKKIIEGKIPAWYFLEEVGALGNSSGDIAVSDFHANLIFNKGKGRFSDVKKLTDKLKKKVKKKFGITLEEEVRVVV